MEIGTSAACWWCSGGLQRNALPCPSADVTPEEGAAGDYGGFIGQPQCLAWSQLGQCQISPMVKPWPYPCVDAATSVDGGASMDAATSADGAGETGTVCQEGGTDVSASCCTNACASGATQCLSRMSLQTCAVEANGCTASTTTTCAAGLVCERYSPAACLDPAWAEWPMPNSQADVTAGAPNLEAYTDNGDGTVTDNVTDLMWQQTGTTAAYPWASAVAYCQTLILHGRSDWRLPSIIELYSLVDVGRANPPTINVTFFPAMAPNKFWSSTPEADSSTANQIAWAVDFLYGSLYEGSGDNTFNVLCVR